MKLWESRDNALASASEKALAHAVELYTSSDDWKLDRRLVPWDCLGSAAHARMLAHVGILSEDELARALAGLREVAVLSAEGKFEITPADEDCHTAIENYLSEKHGDVGKKIHTGRSRNDQVLTALKLFMKDALLQTAERCVALGEALAAFGRENPYPVPGYTHLQKAMPSTLELWAFAFAEAMIDATAQLKSTSDHIDSSPLGSAAGYGVALPIDREMTARLLGFKKVQRNVIYAQNCRGKNEAQCIHALNIIMSELNKLAVDLIFMSQPELGFVEIPTAFCTGSSIMPQKRNPDVLELLRAKAKSVAALYVQVMGIALDLPSGYNRDFQLTKRPLFEAFEITGSSLDIMTAMIPRLKADPEACQRALTAPLFAADIANENVMRGMPFRDAYRKVKDEISSLAPENALRFITEKRHTGGPGNSGSNEIAGELRQLRSDLVSRRAEQRRLNVLLLEAAAE